MFERELYKSAFGASPLPIVLTDFNGNILDASIGFAMLFDVQRDDLIGINLQEIMDIEIRDNLDVKTSVKGEYYQIFSQKFEVEGFEFLVFSFSKLEQLEAAPATAVLTRIRDIFDMSLKANSFPQFVADSFPLLQSIFNADSVLLFKRSKNQPEIFFPVFSTSNLHKELRDKVSLGIESENLVSIGIPVIADENYVEWPVIPVLLEVAGFASAWVIPFGLYEDFVDSLIFLLFSQKATPSPEEHDLLVFGSYFYSLVYQKMEYKKEFEALSYKDTVSQTFSEAIIKELLNLQCEQAKRYGFSFSVMMIRMENYDKLLNIYGNYAVETSTQKVAQALTSSLRRSDVVGRYSRNSFVVILPFTNSENTDIVFSRILNILKSSTFPPCKNIKFSASITSYMEDTGYQSIINRLTDLLRPIL
ncbi:MAG: diguanylate cyclase domain-containing protein [Candidatus Hydrothermia bacterium]